VDFRREQSGVPAKVAAIEYDPKSRANLRSCITADGDKRYILQPVGSKSAQRFPPAMTRTFFPVIALTFRHIPPGRRCTTRALFPDAAPGGSFGRRFGAVAQQRRRRRADQLPSASKKFSVDCMATVGQVGNLDHETKPSARLGARVGGGIKPTVRGVAMNPVTIRTAVVKAA